MRVDEFFVALFWAILRKKIGSCFSKDDKSKMGDSVSTSAAAQNIEAQVKRQQYSYK